jgi:acyl carrier protein
LSAISTGFSASADQLKDFAMTSPSKQDLLQLISAELEIPVEAIPFGRPISEIPNWDSMAWISIIAAIESRTGKSFPIDRIDDVRNVGDILTLAQG